MLNELHFLPDRSMVIVGGSVFAEVFRRFVESRMRQDIKEEDRNRMFGASQGGFISTLDSQLRLAHAMRWIPDDMFEDALIIQGIRNVFAHSLHDISFEDDSIKADCRRLNLKFPLERSNEDKLPNKPIEFIWYRNWLFVWTNLVSGLSADPLPEPAKLTPEQTTIFSNISALPKEILREIAQNVFKKGSDYMNQSFGTSSDK